MRSSILIQKRARTLRRAMTQPEQLLWAMLRRKQQDGLRFRRQHPLGPYILDFYCASACLCVEVDGPSHNDRAESDRVRDHWLKEQGIRVIRVTVDDLERRPAAVLASIVLAAAPSTAFGGPPPP